MQINGFLHHRWLLLVLRLLIGAVFFYSGAIKLDDPVAFSDSIASFKILSPLLINVVALALPPFELLIGLILISGWRLRAASFSTLVLTALFTVALGQAHYRGLQVDCGCFGSKDPSIHQIWFALARNFFIIAASAVIYTSTLRQKST